jgi:hypothetical protein
LNADSPDSLIVLLSCTKPETEGLRAQLKLYETNVYLVGFQILMAVGMKMAVFSVVAL